MRKQWFGTALLSCVLAVGCGDRPPETSQNLEPNAQPGAIANGGVAETAPAAAPAPGAPPASSPRDVAAGTGAPARISPSPDKGVAAAAPRREASPPAPPAPRFREVTAPAGTALPLELITAVSSETAQVETPVQARLRQAVVVDDFTVLPAGTVFHGNVIEVERAGRVRGRSHLAIRFTEAEIAGAREDVRTNPVSFEGEETKGEDATKVGAGAVGGAIIGGILGGGSGAAKGAAIGGAAGTGVVLATRGREVTLAAGTNVGATLASPFSVRARVD
jgi:hypothetical protein